MPATLSLMGSVRLRGAVGDDLTPRSQKARGALVLLGTAPDLRLSRTRLQDLLWSDRNKQQGSDSLRQMLRELRSALAAEKDMLLTGVGWIGLDPTSGLLAGEGLLCVLVDRDRVAEALESTRKQLSEFEAKILGLYLDGLSCQEIAKAVGKSPKSVDNAVQRVRRKAARQLSSGDISKR